MPRPKGDPHVPYNQQTDFANQDYFSLDSNPRAGDLINLVERVHMGSQDNERGFWKHFYAGETNYALEQLKYVLWVFPNHPVALHMLGVMAKDMGSPTVPIAYYEKAIQLFPHVAYTYAQYGAYLVEIGYARQGMIELRQALAMDPSLVQAQAWLSKANAEVTLNTKK
jgi:Tfp pilus assembly protein PilF